MIRFRPSRLLPLPRTDTIYHSLGPAFFGLRTTFRVERLGEPEPPEAPLTRPATAGHLTEVMGKMKQTGARLIVVQPYSEDAQRAARSGLSVRWWDSVALASVCRTCPVCRTARRRQAGMASPAGEPEKNRTRRVAIHSCSAQTEVVNSATPTTDRTATGPERAPQQPPASQPNDARAAKHEADMRQLRERLAPIRHKILVLSGKGGVGKSTVAANLAMALAAEGCEVGLLDIDIHGPSIPKLMGLERESRGPSADPGGIQPVAIGPNLKVMSIGFLLQSPRDAVIWRGPLKYKLIEQFLRDVVWGNLDLLVVDSPPGTGDEPLSIAQLVGPPAAAIVVTTPQDVALADVRRSITFCQQLRLEVLGVLENMSGFVCPHCGQRTDLFKSGGGETLAQEMAVPFLGRIPLSKSRWGRI